MHDTASLAIISLAALALNISPAMLYMISHSLEYGRRQ
jgi:threonine/homoserine/homoserine lactone efflux protein